ncbi:glycoside hydrolase [Aspergillus keveii]|uniref:Alpha-galactosidase n=1 Tax=Aspergillus keveii TaxID=714993 RepID=A0ABR4FME1_9EURO
MGWNPWNTYDCNIREAIVLDAAENLVTSGLRDAGYDHVNIDDCWQVKSGRDNVTNELIPGPVNFPRGIKGVADDIHDLGLKLGIYSSAGTETCAEYPASLYYEDIDAASFAAWGVDYLKYDNCGVPRNWSDPYTACTDRWSDTVNGTCVGLSNPAPEDYDWGTSLTAERYRRMGDALAKQDRAIHKDIRANWGRVLEILNRNSFLMNYVEFGVGVRGLTSAQERTHFAFWALMKSPLIIGASLTVLTDDQLALLKNSRLISFNQDRCYEKPAAPYKWGTNPDWTFDASFPAEYWSGESRAGTFIAMLNTGSAAANKTALFSEIPELRLRRRYKIVDAWTGENLGCYSKQYTALVESHDTTVLIAKPC